MTNRTPKKIEGDRRDIVPEMFRGLNYKFTVDVSGVTKCECCGIINCKDEDCHAQTN